MKKLSLILLFIMPMWAFAQNSYLDNLYDKYSGKDGYTSVYITKYMFELFAEINNDEELKEFQDISSSLDAIKIITTSDSADDTQIATFKNDVLNNIPKSVYKDLMIIKEDKKIVWFKIRKEGKKIAELMILANDEIETVLIYLSGDIDLKKISKLSHSMKIDGFEYLDRINK